MLVYQSQRTYATTTNALSCLLAIPTFYQRQQYPAPGWLLIQHRNKEMLKEGEYPIQVCRQGDYSSLESSFTGGGLGFLELAYFSRFSWRYRKDLFVPDVRIPLIL